MKAQGFTFLQRGTMTSIFHVLQDNQVLLLFVLIGFGALFSKLRIRGISLGAAAVLFFSIALTAWGAAQGYELRVEHDLGVLGLALFAFAIGISSGASFFQTIRSSVKPVLLMLSVVAVAACAAGLIGRMMGMKWAMIAGTFAGAVTNTPALSAAGQASGDPATATIGYAIAYLFGVIGMLGWAMLALSKRGEDTDAPSPIVNRTVRVELEEAMTVAAARKKIGEDAHFSRLRRGEDGRTWVPTDADILQKDDMVTVVGTSQAVDCAVELLGHVSSHSLMSDRNYLDFRRITLSNTKLANLTVQEIALEDKFGATITRIRRGDTDIVAHANEPLRLGDRIRVIAPAEKMRKISKYLGDSAFGITNINPFALGIGMTLGILIGELEFLTPSGLKFSIGSAAGTLIVGLIMGKLGKVGRIITTIPYDTCQVLSEFGLLVFLAYAGTTAGSRILHAFVGGAWLQILVLGAIVTTIMGAGLYFSMRCFAKMGGTRLSGVLAGTQTQPAVLAFSNDRTTFDPRVALGYAMVYPIAMVAKIFCGQILGSFAGF